MNTTNSVADDQPLADISTDRIRPKEAARIGEVSVGTIYAWMHLKCFDNWDVRRRGRERGVRYISRKSFMEFLQSTEVGKGLGE